MVQSKKSEGTAMATSWQTETGHLACRWSDLEQHAKYDPSWMQKISDVPSGYLELVPDFASHSPFGGANWFRPRFRTRTEAVVSSRSLPLNHHLSELSRRE